jgi:hypothetical protein
MDRRLTAALRARFASERFYDPDADAIAISAFVHDFEATERAAGTRAARADYACQVDEKRPLTTSGTPSLALLMNPSDDEEVDGGLSPASRSLT